MSEHDPKYDRYREKAIHDRLAVADAAWRAAIARRPVRAAGDRLGSGPARSVLC